ncbi:hypothetical protein [Streptomyces bauhiniae]|uniref:Uncharacterized protein n=1 Tax=Streptomyces bauhiniae TaxID=2340725 RepID=A0A7K3QRC6_9ACTN|nr:hypothetical protein [Streptomyces bauhiniae]NEB92393.1 hypothetical protein [Streptomyces bauhiniae]
MTSHNSPHPLAGQTVTVNAHLHGNSGPHEFTVEDWNDRVFGQSWAAMERHPASMAYAIRTAWENLPLDNEVIYGKVGPFGHLIHVTEIQDAG